MERRTGKSKKRRDRLAPANVDYGMRYARMSEEEVSAELVSRQQQYRETVNGQVFSNPLIASFFTARFFEDELPGFEKSEDLSRKFAESNDTEEFRPLYAGRVSDPHDSSNFDLAGEATFLGILVEEIADTLDIPLHKFDISMLSRSDYQTVIESFKQILLRTDKSQLDFGNPERDMEVSEFLMMGSSIAMLGLISGNQAVVRQATEALKEAYSQDSVLGGDFIDAADQDSRVNELFIYTFPEKPRAKEIIAQLKQDYGDWPQTRNNLMIYGAYKRQLASLSRFASPKVARHHQERTRLLRDWTLLEEHIPQLRIRIKEKDEAAALLAERLRDAVQLGFPVLPEGQGEVQRAAEKIVAEIRNRSRNPEAVQIDPTRIHILETVRQAWGQENSFYAIGTLSGKRKVEIDENEGLPEEYIVLVLQDPHDPANEHAIAERPITGTNALYVHRHDVSAGNWKEIFSLPRDEALQFGARRLWHRSPEGTEMVENMSTKVLYLLQQLGPKEFSETAIETNRIQRLYRDIGKAAVNKTEE